MQVTDYRTLIDPTKTYGGLASTDGVYAAGDGVQYRSSEHDGLFFHEAVRLSDEAYLLATEVAPTEDSRHIQVVDGDDWLHLQFRFKGGGFERVGAEHTVETPERSCIISRYPEGSMISREIRRADTWKYACLYLQPTAFTGLLDMPEDALPEGASWLGAARHEGFRSDTLPLTPAMMAPLSDIFSCAYRGPVRRAYMRAKSLEILSTLVHALDRPASAEGRGGVKLSASDLAKLAQAREVMLEDLENGMSLATLARRVGLNRTKLALGFKAIYGDSVQAFWRDARLIRARELLQSGEVGVTEAAFTVGYAEISSFTRAFTRKFGVLPKAYKPKAAAHPRPAG
ncbi:MAG: helix-turn-helix domain-containing protein [Phenylobacterium sp.]|uniref:helix-turn-helix domain-containing protein n=1 Tax=Phenylobacterium sp. TaxID=1871053 RepID=UPI0025FE0838|nr:AraC family transcriptional regulator [Phenylobacterium sp.]MBI1199003.1 helix-turn-helix domain-containing protein [Phenylobacterium sp.]